jgi:short-subunit dehydrogenase
LNYSPHVAHQLINKRKAKALPLGLAAHKGVKKLIDKINGSAGAIVNNAHFNRQGPFARAAV